MECSACGADNPASRKFCRECGARLELRCPTCGAANQPDDKFCGECGAALVAPRTAASLAGPATGFASPEAYTPPHLAERILSSRAALEGERKQVTVLFADLQGSTALVADRDPEEARRALDPVLALMMEAVHRYEGTVNQVLGDGVMALFGAPVAHEDHALRACYAALSMQERVRAHGEELRRREGVPIAARVGLNSGEVVVRSIASDLHMDYTAVGQTTHLAARMEQAALPGAIQLSAETLRLVEGYVQVRPLGPMQLRGFDTPVDAFELLGVGAARTRLQAAAARGLTRFVGRDAEMETLRQALERAGGGRGQVVAAVGEPGVGKSRLVHELVHSHRTHGWLVLESSSVSYGKATPYLPVSELLRGYFRVEPPDDVRRVREKVNGKILTLDDGLRPYLPAYLTLLDVPLDDPEWGTLDPQVRRQRTVEALRRLLLRESQEQPLLVVFEDLHWIDPETQGVLDGLVESLGAARVLLLVNYRPEYQHTWGSRTYYTQLRLDPLGGERADELLAALLGHDPSLDSVKHLLIARTEGNPFFLEESVRTLVEGEALDGERGAYRLTRAVETTQVPATVQAILASRIDRLGPQEKRLLQCAAAIGVDVPYALLRALAEEEFRVSSSEFRLSAPGLGARNSEIETQLRQQLARLQAAEFLYEAALFPELEYTFKHALTHEVAYASLLAERRRALHARLVGAIEVHYAGRLADHVEALAQHAVRGEAWEKAVTYLQEASAKAAARASYGEAVRLLEQALEAQERLDPADQAARCDLLVALGEALPAAGEPRRAFEQVAEEAFDLADGLGDRRRAFRSARMALEAIQAYGSGTMHPTAVRRRWAERADAAAAPGSAERVYADYALATEVRLLGTSAADLERARRALASAQELGEGYLRFLSVPRLLNYSVPPRHRDEQLRLAHDAMGWDRAGVHPATLQAVLRACGSIFLAAGDRAAAEEAWRAMEQLGPRTQQPHALVAEPLVASLRSLLDGELEEAVAAGERAVARADELGMPLAGRQWSDNVMLRPLVYLGRGEEALAGMRRRIAEADAPAVAGAVRDREPLCLASLGRLAEARSVLGQLMAELRSTIGEEQAGAGSLAVLLEAAVLSDDRESVATIAPWLDGVVATHYTWLSVANVARALGEAAVLCGDRAAARAHFERSLEWATKVRHRPEIALTRLCLAELLLDEAISFQPSAVSTGRGEGELMADKLKAEGSAHLDFAIEELRAMKMQPALERALQCKATLTV